ncbi:MAG: (4Fe-4S)-binding protein [Gaiellaceae bacterium]
MSEKIAKPTREYATEEIVVEWRPSLCYHSQNCIAALPRVFDPQRRPWIDVTAAGADEVEAAVAHCPSGALRARRPNAEASVDTSGATEIRATPNGPLLVRGNLRIVGADGTELARLERAALCRCGQSGNKPFCDGTHEHVGFQDGSVSQ